MISELDSLPGYRLLEADEKLDDEFPHGRHLLLQWLYPGPQAVLHFEIAGWEVDIRSRTDRRWIDI